MKLKIVACFLLGLSAIAGCQRGGGETNSVNSESNAVSQKTPSPPENSDSGKAVPSEDNTAEKTTVSQENQPRTVRDYFNILPQKYFTLEGCEPEKDKNCEKARREYVKNYLEVEDAKNGFWKSGCDGAQSCLTLALFKRPDGTYVIAVHTLQEADETNYFLDYAGGKWTDISAKIVPEFSDKNIYELPRYGTNVEVFKKNFPEPEYSERGAKIYSLEWKDGKFVKK